MKAIAVDARFLLVTALGYIVALASTAAVVWLTAQPVLETMTHRARSEQLAAAVHELEALLVARQVEVEFLARNSQLQAFVLGFEQDPTVLTELLSDIGPGSGVITRLQVYDYAGRSIASGVTATDAAITNDSALELRVKTLFSQQSTTAQIRYHPQDDPTHHLFQIIAPILIEGSVEGAVAVSLLIQQATLQTAAALSQVSLQTAFQVENAAAWYPDEKPGLEARVGQSDFYLYLPPDRMTVATQGNQLVRRVMSAAVLALVVPFGIMAVVGHRAIVAPARALAESREQLELQKADLQIFGQVAEMSGDAFFINDKDHSILWVNDAIETISGYTPQEALGKHPREMVVHPDDQPALQKDFKVKKRSGPMRKEIRCIHKSGEVIWIDLRVSPFRDENGEITRYCSIWTDITERKRQEDDLNREREKSDYQAMHDTLTGLTNRRFLDELLQAEFQSDLPPRTLIRVDLDHFKNVNDTLGHAAGDHVLKEVSQILASGVRSGDIVSRVGGDEFVIACEIGVTAEDAETLCERLLTSVRKEIEFEGSFCRIGASFGIASAVEGLVPNTELLMSADAALYLAKEQGRNTVILYTPEVHRDVQEHRRFAAQIERAIINEEIEPFFQPQFSAKDLSFSGMEALARWRHPTEGILSPAAFLPIATKLSIVPEIDKLIFRRGLESVRELADLGIFVPKISFNVGARQLEDPMMADIVREPNIGDSVISFEVLESVLIEEQSQSFAFSVDALRELGVLIEVDDFGSGHASIIGLRKLAPDVMKIDQRLVLPLTDSVESRDILKALIGIGRTMGIKVTAEGVETAAHASILKDLGCDTLQGYHFAKPLALPDLIPLVRNRSAWPGKPGQLKR